MICRTRTWTDLIIVFRRPKSCYTILHQYTCCPICTICWIIGGPIRLSVLSVSIQLTVALMLGLPRRGRPWCCAFSVRRLASARWKSRERRVDPSGTDPACDADSWWGPRGHDK